MLIFLCFLLLWVSLFCFVAYSKQDQTLQNWFISRVSIAVIPFLVILYVDHGHWSLGGFVCKCFFFLHLLVCYKSFLNLVFGKFSNYLCTMANLTAWNLTIPRGLNVIIFFPYTSSFLERQKRLEMRISFSFIIKLLISS